VTKLKPSAVMTIGCGGLLVIGSLGGLMSVAGSGYAAKGRASFAAAVWKTMTLKPGE
jgi:hypothetical protein